MARDGIRVHIYGDYDDKDIRKAQRDLESLKKGSGDTTTSFAGLAKGALGLGAALGVGFAGVQAVADFMRDSFAEAQESIKATAATAQIIQSTGGAAKVTAQQVGDLANRISELIGVDDELIQSSANLILTFKNVKNEGIGLNAVFDRTVMAAQDLAAAGFGDAESAAKMLGKALNDPVAGMTALSRAGVTFTQSQKDQIKALIESGDLLAAQKVILGEVESQVGGVAGATATSADKFNVLMKNMQEALGLAIMPLLNALMTALIPAIRGLTSFITNFSTAVSDNAGVLRVAVVAVGALTASLLVQRGVLTFNTIAFAAKTVAVNAYVASALAARAASLALATAMRAIPVVALATGVYMLGDAWFRVLQEQTKVSTSTATVNGKILEGVQVVGNARNANNMYAQSLQAAAGGGRAATNAISGTVASALSLGKTLPSVTDKTYDAADAASTAAKSYIDMWTAIVEAQRQSRDMTTTSGTVTSAIAEGVTKGADLTAERLKEIREGLEGVSRSARGGGSAAKEQVEKVAELRREWRATTSSITADVEGLRVTLSTKGDEMSSALAEKFRSRLDVFRGIVTEQQQIINQAQASLDSYSKSVVDTILGGIQIGTKDAEGKALTPEQIVESLFGGVENQRKAVEAVAAIATKVPEALAQQLISLTSTDPKGAIALANYLANNPAQVEQLTKNYNELSTFTKTALGEPMALAFAQVGDESAVSMLSSARQKIKEEAEDFQKWVASKLKSRVTVEVEYRAVNTPPVGARAAGGPVMGGSPYIVGERGPELFVPNVSGTIVPNHDLRSGGGSGVGGSVVINVNAGMGTDGAEVGRQVVDALKAYSRRNGPLPLAVAS
jgi:hypothetical protein